jgi:large subunit ribosomal protein L25
VLEDGKEHPALVREKQRDYIKNRLLHVDFQAVSLTEKIRAAVRVVLTGLSPAVKDYNAVIVSGLDELEVEALPQDLPERISVDVAILAKIGDSIHVRDLIISDKVKMLSNPDDLIALASLTKEEAEPEVVATTEVVEPEVIERGKKDEEEGEDESEPAEKKKA